jgi:hypothetical protein
MNSLSSILRNIETNFVGERCLNVLFDPSSALLMDFGRERPLARPVDSNPTLTEWQRRFEGEKALFVTGPWLIATSLNQRGYVGEQKADAIRAISGCVVTEMRISDSNLNVDVDFDNGARLSVQVDTRTPFHSYYFRIDRTFWSIEADGGLVESHRAVKSQ